jgi:hypothetical protein
MISLGRRNFNLTEQITEASARRTTLTVAAVALIIGVWQFHRSRPAAAVALVGFGGLIMSLAIIVPVFAKWFHQGWMRLAEALGWINTRVLLTVVFYGLLTPMKIIRRTIGHDPLSRRGVPQSSYWVGRTAERRSGKSFEQAF